MGRIKEKRKNSGIENELEVKKAKKSVSIKTKEVPISCDKSNKTDQKISKLGTETQGNIDIPYNKEKNSDSRKIKTSKHDKEEKLSDNVESEIVKKGNSDSFTDFKKKGKNKKKKKEKITDDNDDVEKEDEDTKEQSAKDLAICYLKQWKKHQKEWKFQKVRQVWLLNHMYNTEMLSDKYFKILLLYLDGMKGMARQKTSTEAQSIIESDCDDVLKVDRARQIVQQLSTE